MAIKAYVGQMVTVPLYREKGKEEVSTFPAVINEVISQDSNIVDLTVFTNNGPVFKENFYFSTLPRLGHWSHILNSNDSVSCSANCSCF